MQQRLYSDSAAMQNLLEVVDASNKTLCLMPVLSVQEQHLPCKAVGLLLRDRSGRFLLTHRQEVGWDVSSFDLLRAGHSHEQTASELLHGDWGQEGCVHALGLVSPDPGGSPTFTYLYEARIPTTLAHNAARDAASHLLVDYDELHGLTANFASIFSPLLCKAVQAGLVRPRCRTMAASSTAVTSG
ncbi:MAG: NUDIX hydrolase [Desulfovibrio sp.]|nr:NUDIX hydrolase [Desulfovibrio sp.]